MTTTLGLTYTGTLELVPCPACGMEFGVLPHFDKARRRDHKTFYCPWGHSMSYNGESDIEKAERLRKNAVQRMEWAETRAQAARDQAEASERSARAYKGHLTRARNKIANGVCPVAGCQRHFDNVQRHIERMHPAWSITDPETGEAAVL